MTATQKARSEVSILRLRTVLFGGVVAMALLPALTARGPVRKVYVVRSAGLLGEHTCTARAG